MAQHYWLPCASAVDYWWANHDDGDFRKSVNWTPFNIVFAGPGDADDFVHFDLGTAPEDRYVVSNVSGENDGLLVHNDSIKLEIGKYTVHSKPSRDTNFVVGVNDGDVADVVLTGVHGSKLEGFTRIGDEAGSIGSVTVAGSDLDWDGPVSVGSSGTGTLTITDGASARGKIGASDGSDGTVIVRGTGSTWSGNVGNGGTGRLIIEDGGRGSGAIFGFLGGTGFVTVRGPNSSFTRTSDFTIIGYEGSATLTVEDGATASHRDIWAGGWNVEACGTATVRVSGAGSTWNATDDLIAASCGTATIDIEDGGSLTNVNGWIALHAGGTGSVTVRDPGSSWTNEEELFVGEIGTGTLSIESGGAVTNTNGWIGRGADSNGTVTVQDSGSTWTNENELLVGGSGTGSLTIRNGGTVSNHGVWIGNSPGSTGMAIVSGSDSKWKSSGQFIVGYRGMGTLRIEAGTVSTDNNSFVGFTPGGSGSMATVTGDRSNWLSSGVLTVGNSGSASLMISEGGTVSNSDGIIGNHSEASMVTVTGKKSIWKNTGDLTVGGSGQGTLIIEDGGRVTSFNGLVGADSSVTVNGIGSRWTTDNLNLRGTSNSKEGGTATLEVGSGGAVAVADEIELFEHSRIDLQGGFVSASSITLDQKGTFEWNSGTLQTGLFDGELVNDGGILAPGPNISSTKINGDYTQQSGASLAIDLGGDQPGDGYDHVAVGGSAFLGGDLQLTLVDDYLPNSFDVFRLVEAKRVSGTFDNVDAGQRLMSTGGRGSFIVHYGHASKFGSSQLVLSDFLPNTNTILGDFDQNGQLDATDIDLLSAALDGTDLTYDLNADGSVTALDHALWVHEIKNTFFGDANLDGQFDSSDFIRVFEKNEYEDDQVRNSTWSTGDWDGNLEFDSGDIVFAFAAGGYEAGPRVEAVSIPEPSTAFIFWLGNFCALSLRRRWC